MSETAAFAVVPIPPDPIMVPTPIGTGEQLLCDGLKYDQQHFLDLFDRIFPAQYIESIKNGVEAGYELFQMMAAVGARVSEAIEEAECGLLSIFAEGPVRALSRVVFTRPDPGTPLDAVTIEAGTLVSTSKGGLQFVTTEDLVFDEELELDVAVQAVAPGSEFNVRGQLVSAAGEVLEGEIDTIDTMFQDPPHTDRTFSVYQVQDAVGGQDGWLDAAGDNRGIYRTSPDEGDTTYRQRMRQAPDTISPGAVERLAHAILDPYGIDFELIETWDAAYLSCWDAPSPNIGTPTYQAVMPVNPAFDTHLFAYDDEREGYQNRWVDSVEMRGMFIVVIQETSITALPMDQQAAIAGLYLSLQKIKAGGIAAVVDYLRDW